MDSIVEMCFMCVCMCVYIVLCWSTNRILHLTEAPSSLLFLAVSLHSCVVSWTLEIVAYISFRLLSFLSCYQWKCF